MKKQLFSTLIALIVLTSCGSEAKTDRDENSSIISDNAQAFTTVSETPNDIQSSSSTNVSSSSVETTQLFKDYFEPYINSIGQEIYDEITEKTKSINGYDVSIEEEKITIIDMDENTVYIKFYPSNIGASKSEWIETLTNVTYINDSNHKAIHILDNAHKSGIEYNTFDPKRDPSNLVVDSYDELIRFMFG